MGGVLLPDACDQGSLVAAIGRHDAIGRRLMRRPLNVIIGKANVGEGFPADTGKEDDVQRGRAHSGTGRNGDT